MSLVIAEHVSFSYDGKPVLNNVTFRVNAGDYLAVIGENGSGKSTLIKGLLRLKEPSSGTILYSDGLVANEIGYLPQKSVIPHDFPASVLEVVLSGCVNRMGFRPFYSASDKDAARERLQWMNAANWEKRSFRDLSGGQQQRVLLARALMATRKLILLDEPLSGLDPKVSSDLSELISRIRAENGITVISVSHDLPSVIRDASHILHLGNGQLFFGTVSEYERSAVGRNYLSVNCPVHVKGVL